MPLTVRAAYGVLTALAIGACQSGAGSPSVSATASSNATAGPSPALTSTGPTSTAAASESHSSSSGSAAIDPALITRPALTCGDPQPRFSPEALEGLGLGEFGLDPAAAVLRATVADTPDYLPDSGWYRVADGPDGVMFVARGNAATPWFEVIVGAFDGVLQAIRMGQCHLGIAAPDGVTLARWWLDPAGPPVTLETTQVAILLREQACASGRPPEGRVLPPTVVMDPDAIRVVVGITITPGGADCPGNPSYATTLSVPEPIGGRRLLDASVYPPRPVTTEDPG